MAQIFGNKLNFFAILKNLITERGIGFFTNAGVPANGAAGAFATYAAPGSMLVDTLTGVWYVNTGTLAVPVWAGMSGAVAANGGLGIVGNAKMTYDFAVDGGVVGLITPANSPTIPDNAIILGGTIDITTTLTSGGAATIALGTSAGSSATSLKAATAVATWAAGQIAVVPVFTAATYVKLTAAGRLTLTVAAFDLTAGKFDVNLVYVVGN
jgi:hypothetical protein